MTANEAFEHRIGASTLRVISGDIATVSADVVVASDDNKLIVDGGVALALSRAGGDQIYAEARQRLPLALGAVIITNAGRLPASKVFHAIVVDRGRGLSTTKELVRNVVKESLRLCDENQFRTIAFPALATGAGGFSAAASAMAMIVEIVRHLEGQTNIRTVGLVLHQPDGEATDVAGRFYDQIRAYLSVIERLGRVERALDNAASRANPLKLDGDLRGAVREASKHAVNARKTLEHDVLLSDPELTGDRWATGEALRQLGALQDSLTWVGQVPAAAGSETSVRLESLETDVSNARAALKRRPLVVSLHGIRTRGAWQKEITYPMNRAGFDHQPLDYGFFGLIKFLLPFAREGRVRWFRDKYFELVRQLDQRPSVIAHSLGTYIVAEAIAKYDVKFNRVVFCGAIVPRDYDWLAVVRSGGAQYVLNDYGGMDLWVRLVPNVVTDAGLSGLVGFAETAGGRVINRSHERFQHSDYFYEGNYLEGWIPFLQGRSPSVPSNPAKAARNWRPRLALLAAASILAVAIAWRLGWLVW